MFKVGDRVRVKGFFLAGRTGVLTNQVGHWWAVKLDEPVFMRTIRSEAGEIVESYCFSEERMEILEKGERILNLETDPYGEENWYE